jgi:hypothetical protein
MKGHLIRKAAVLSAIVCLIATVIVFYGAVNEARASVSIPSTTYEISGSISTTSTLQDAWLVGEYSNPESFPPDLFFAQQIGANIPGGETTPFSISVSYAGPAPSFYSILTLYPPDGGVAVGSNDNLAGIEWHREFPDQVEYNLSLFLNYSSASILGITAFYQEYASILSAPMGEGLSLWSFQTGALDGSASANVVPLPAAVLLFGPGLAGLAVIRKRLST